MVVSELKKIIQVDSYNVVIKKLQISSCECGIIESKTTSTENRN
ncbi:hypothetical protein Fluta_0497 [Fluviicola taffensis DSM 16823]|uniref:Uncharacterized protein n=1 Tax=Fluviicola taffensis (strain DSM 16823 / NCIMB 13979 / RW262) TaxID=755732 RepID=F2IFP4_FLUTR|nr:hypothetical protein Fluta_0497 [Fluviicola taffensis DSM 16823]